ncbi:MAG TPA: hypothetical protein VGQ99_17510 [Tepidisphaeraceae bacterium]|nr:hypothetical protein [Tepidisphaeraceae bacterium]
MALAFWVRRMGPKVVSHWPVNVREERVAGAAARDTLVIRSTAQKICRTIMDLDELIRQPNPN